MVQAKPTPLADISPLISEKTDMHETSNNCVFKAVTSEKVFYYSADLPAALSGTLGDHNPQFPNLPNTVSKNSTGLMPILLFKASLSQ